VAPTAPDDRAGIVAMVKASHLEVRGRDLDRDGDEIPI